MPTLSHAVKGGNGGHEDGEPCQEAKGRYHSRTSKVGIGGDGGNAAAVAGYRAIRVYRRAIVDCARLVMRECLRVEGEEDGHRAVELRCDAARYEEAVERVRGDPATRYSTCVRYLSISRRKRRSPVLQIVLQAAR